LFYLSADNGLVMLYPVAVNSKIKKT